MLSADFKFSLENNIKPKTVTVGYCIFKYSFIHR